MRISSIRVGGLPPIREFSADELSSVVIVAGANGSGKTRLKQAIIDTFKNARAPKVGITVESTRRSERDRWQRDRIDVQVGAQNDVLHAHMQSRTRGGTYVSSVIQIDSDRSVSAVKFNPITLATPDPDEEEINNTYFLELFTGRWQHLVNKIYMKAANRDNKIAKYVKENPDSTTRAALAANPDPFIQYQEVFAKLLPGKTLEPIDPKSPREFRYKIGAEGPFEFESLSSGEREVVKVAFDLVWKRIRDCVVLIDEPELHLHPTLAFRLIETLKGLGANNQWILFTHSADLISTYYTSGSVVFIDHKASEGNQARRLVDVGENHGETARAVGASLGVFAVGKNIVFVEGRDASVDRLTYHKISQYVFPEAHVFPLGQVHNLSALRAVNEELRHALFGINLFMVRDRDGLSDEQVASLETNNRFRVLRRRQVENYFLDPEVLAMVADRLYLDGTRRDAESIQAALQEAAESSINAAVMLCVKEYVRMNGAVACPSLPRRGDVTLDDVCAELVQQVRSNADQVASEFAADEFESAVERERRALERSLTDGSWVDRFPGKPVLGHFCGQFFGVDANRVRQAYVDLAMERKAEALQDVVDMLRAFGEDAAET